MQFVKGVGGQVELGTDKRRRVTMTRSDALQILNLMNPAKVESGKEARNALIVLMKTKIIVKQIRWYVKSALRIHITSLERKCVTKVLSKSLNQNLIVIQIQAL